MKKIAFFAFATGLLAWVSSGKAAEITLFYLPTCSHCHNAMGFMDAELKGVSVEKIDVSKSENVSKFSRQLKKCELSSQGVPLMVVKGKCLQGFDVETGNELKRLLGKK